MRSIRFSGLIFAIIFFFSCYSQDIYANLAAHFSANISTVTNTANIALCNITGEDLSSPGLSTEFNSSLNNASNSAAGSFKYIVRRAFFVSPNGTGGDGRSWVTAWKPVSNDIYSTGWDSTSNHPLGINWDIIQPGDTIYIDGGSNGIDYTLSSYLLPKANGTYDDYIYIVKGQDAGHNGTPILDRIGAMNGSSGPGHMSDSSLIHNHCIEFNGFQVNGIIAHQDEVQTNNFVANGYHLRFKNITNDDVYTDKFLELTGHPRYVEIINCHLRQRNTSQQTDLIWVRGDADYTGGGLWADSIYITGCTLIGTNQSTSPHTDGIQTFTTKNIWIEGNKFYVANNKSNYTQILYNEEVSGKIFVLNNLFYVAAPNATSPEIGLSRNYTYLTITPDVDSVYFYDNTVVAQNIGGRTPYIERATQISMGNNIFINTASGDTHIQIYTMNTETTSDYNIIYSPNMTRKVYRLGSYYNLASWQATGRDIHSTSTQPTFTSFDWSFSQTEVTYLDYDFSVPSPVTGMSFSARMGDYTFSSDGKIGASITDEIIPVELSSFSASVNNDNVSLSWTIATEVNNYGFDVERKSVTSNTWNSLGFIEGRGTTTEPKTYVYQDFDVTVGSYNYRIKQIDYNGNMTYYNLAETVVFGAPTKFELAQNYPNPFNPVTKIKYTIPTTPQSPSSEGGEAKQGWLTVLKVFDVLGNEVATLVDEYKNAGSYEVEFNMTAGRQGTSSIIHNTSTGVYFYQLKVGNYIQTKKMIFLK